MPSAYNEPAHLLRIHSPLEDLGSGDLKFTREVRQWKKQGVMIWNQPKQCLIVRQNYHIFTLIDSPKKIGGIQHLQKVADGCIELWGWLWINVCGWFLDLWICRGSWVWPEHWCALSFQLPRKTFQRIWQIFLSNISGICQAFTVACCCWLRWPLCRSIQPVTWSIWCRITQSLTDVNCIVISLP